MGYSKRYLITLLSIGLAWIDLSLDILYYYRVYSYPSIELGLLTFLLFQP